MGQAVTFILDHLNSKQETKLLSEQIGHIHKEMGGGVYPVFFSTQILWKEKKINSGRKKKKKKVQVTFSLVDYSNT